MDSLKNGIAVYTYPSLPNPTIPYTTVLFHHMIKESYPKRLNLIIEFRLLILVTILNTLVNINAFCVMNIDKTYERIWYESIHCPHSITYQ